MASESGRLPARIVCATRLPRDRFLTESATGASIVALRHTSPVEVRLFAENKLGLGEVYNAAIEEAKNNPAMLVFVHDDVLLTDFYWTEVIRRGLERFDVVGVVGNKRRVPYQASWILLDLKFTFDKNENLSGAVGQDKRFPPGQLDFFGLPGAECKLMDGLLLAAFSSTLHKSGLRFDPQFGFHFYDMDVCRQAESLGLSMGTIPLSVVHGSYGRLDEKWHAAYKKYIDKWGE